jgi:MFS family permease
MEFVHGGLLLVLLPVQLRGELGLPLSTVGLALSAYGLADLGFKIPAGWFVDRAGSKRAFLVAMVLSFASLLFLSQATAPWMIILGCVLHGAGASPVWPAAISGATARTEQRGQVMGQIFTAWLGGTGLGAAVTAGLLGIGGRGAFGLLAGVVLLAAVLTLAAVPAGRVMDTHAVPLAQASAAIRHVARRLHLLALGMFLQTFAAGMLVPVLVPYARDVLRLSHAELILLLTVGPGLTVLLLIPLGRLADRLGSQRVVGAAVLLAPLALWAVPACGVVWCLAPLTAALGAGYALVLPAWNAVLLGRVPQQGRGMILGLIMALEGLGAALGPTAGGRIADLQGPAAPFRAAALVFGAAAILFHLWRRRQAHGLEVAAT